MKPLASTIWQRALYIIFDIYHWTKMAATLQIFLTWSTCHMGIQTFFVYMQMHSQMPTFTSHYCQICARNKYAHQIGYTCMCHIRKSIWWAYMGDVWASMNPIWNQWYRPCDQESCIQTIMITFSNCTGWKQIWLHISYGQKQILLPISYGSQWHNFPRMLYETWIHTGVRYEVARLNGIADNEIGVQT